MRDTISISGTDNSYSYGRDQYGEYGSLVQPESEQRIPEALELAPPDPSPE